MTDEELRTIVRDAVLRHLSMAQAPGGTVAPATQASAAHPSFARYALPRGTELEGPCLIEPSVRCNHCGYCQSHGF